MAHSLVVVDEMVRAAQPSLAADSPPERVFAETLKAPRRKNPDFWSRLVQSSRRCLPTTHERDEANVCHRNVAGEIVKDAGQGGLYHFIRVRAPCKGCRGVVCQLEPFGRHLALNCTGILVSLPQSPCANNARRNARIICAFHCFGPVIFPPPRNDRGENGPVGIVSLCKSEHFSWRAPPDKQGLS